MTEYVPPAPKSSHGRIVLPASLQYSPSPDVLNTPEKVQSAVIELRLAIGPSFEDFARARRDSWKRARDAYLD